MVAFEKRGYDMAPLAPLTRNYVCGCVCLNVGTLLARHGKRDWKEFKTGDVAQTRHIHRSSKSTRDIGPCHNWNMVWSTSLSFVACSMEVQLCIWIFCAQWPTFRFDELPWQLLCGCHRVSTTQPEPRVWRQPSSWMERARITPFAS